MIKAVLFDLGDTLIRCESTDPRHYYAEGIHMGYDYLSQQYNNLPPFEKYSRKIYHSIALSYVWSRIIFGEVEPISAVQKAHRGLGISLDTEQANELAERYFQPMKEAYKAEPDAVDTIRTIHEKGYRLGIISNTFTPPRALDNQLADYKLLEFFPIRVYSCDVGKMKPHRRIFEKALEELNLPGESCIYVGDKPKIDVRGAHRMGMTAILKLGDRTPKKIHPSPDFVIHELAEILPILDSIGSPLTE